MRAFGIDDFGQELHGTVVSRAKVVPGWCRLSAYLLIYIPRREISLEPTIRIFILIVIGQPELLLHLVVFIVSRVDDNGWVMSQPADVGNAFLLY